MLLASATVVSCGGGDKTANTAASDTATIEQESAVKTFERQPDTTFASVEAIQYQVDVMLPDIDGRIESLKDMYAANDGSMLTFRGGPFRDAPQTGVLEGEPSEIEVAWRFTTDSDAKWGGGSGWNGQPVYVRWSESQLAEFKKLPTSKEALSAEEIIVGSLCGNVYFIDFESGKASREPLKARNPIKGSVSLDPTLNGNLYVGQGIRNEHPFGALTANLYQHRYTHAFDVDPKAWRNWGAYDSSCIRVGQFLFRPGENGTFYKWLVGKDGDMKLHSTLRFRRGGKAAGIESSLAVYGNYGYFGDNQGVFLCVNLDTMKPVWYFDNHDDTDASPVLAVENGKPYLYIGCEVDKQGTGTAYLTKLNALNGEKVWEYTYPSRLAKVGSKQFDGGYYATPLPGRADCANLIFASVVLNQHGQDGAMVAIDRATGRKVWQSDLKHYGWSSPVAFVDKDNKMYIFVGDTTGNVYLFRGSDGKQLAVKNVAHNFESSPIVNGNAVVVGSRGNEILKMVIK